MKTILIAGLGNPGEKFEKTRHNFGREIVQSFFKEAEFSDWNFEKKWKARVAEKKIGREKVALLLPDTFMNKSGLAIAPAARYFKIKPENIFVIHDDADIPFGSTKLSFGKHSAGHKGAESVMRALKTRNFWRFRIGIASKRNLPAEKIILRKFSREEEKTVKKISKKTLAALEKTISEGPEKAMNEYNQ